jgi:hypothetical protein
MARENGGPVSAGGSYLTGERGMEAFIPAMRESGSSEGNVTYITIDARGAESGVEQKIAAAVRQIIPGVIERSVAATIERQLRTT